MADSKRGKGNRDDNHALIALRHPLRRKILRRMADERKASPCELSKALEQPLSSVAYHVRVLADCTALKSVAQKQRGGSTQHFYRWAVEADWVRELLEADEEQP
jgi:DNA-binding transcriptional ArsR family regulator